MTEIEELIKDKFRKNGVLDMIGQDKISEIKEKIRSIIHNKKLDEVDVQTIQNNPTQTTFTASTQNPNITVKTSEDPEKIEIIKRTTELDLKQKELAEKESKLAEKEKELERKETEISYKPELRERIKEVGAGEIIIFSENELSAGIENLSERKFRIKQNPDSKMSMHDLWLQDAITRSNVYLVELKPIGELIFNPYDGTTIMEFTSGGEVNPSNTNDNSFEHDVNSAIESQHPKQEMLDMVEPIKDVIQPIVNPGIQEPIVNNQTDFKSMIEKIVQDELSRKNNYNLGPGPAGQGVY